MTDIVESLLPCPFCGSGAHMECDKRMVVCDAWGCVATTVYATTALAIKAWNKRAPIAPAQAVTDEMCEAALDADARDRIQGFSYAKRHVIRDVWADKELWSAAVGSPEDYQAFQRQCQIERMRKTLTAALSLSSAERGA